MASGQRIIFAVAAAILAAATVDPIVERLSNAGVFGLGAFTDHSNADVVPALCAGALCSLAFVVLAAMRLLGSGEDIRVPRMLPFIFALQMGALFVMETAEQWYVYGHVLGGALWLGAPVAISLALHAVGCLAVSFVLSRVLRALARQVVAVVRAMVRVTVLGVDARPLRRASFVERVHVFEPLLDHPTVRPPPLTAA